MGLGRMTSAGHRLHGVGMKEWSLRRVMPILVLLLIVLSASVPQTEAKGRANGRFDSPSAVATDVAGNIYVADNSGGYGNLSIQKFTPKGTFITRWGSIGPGEKRLYYQQSIATDHIGNVYVAEGAPLNSGYEYIRNRIQKFTPSGDFITSWGGYGSGNGQFKVPAGIATDAAGNVYVAEFWNDRIQKFTPSGDFITSWGAHGSGDGQFDSPEGIATDAAGNVYVADCANDRIQKFTPDGAFITKWGSKGSGNGQFNFGYYGVGIATDAPGNVYIADQLNDRIQKFTPDGAFITKWGRQGSGDGQFDYPAGVATDAVGNVYVADTGNNRIQKFTSDGRFITEWGRGSGSRAGRTRKPLTIPTTRRKAFFKPSCGLAKRCRARVTIKAGGKVLARGRYSVPAHSSHKVAIALTGAGRKALARKRRVRAKLTIVNIRTRKRETLLVVLRR